MGNFNRTTSSPVHANNQDNLLGNLANKFQVFTECGSLTPLEMCALFQFFCQTPEYKTSCFHQQYHNFYASKSSKQSATANNNSDQMDSNDHGDGWKQFRYKSCKKTHANKILVYFKEAAISWIILIVHFILIFVVVANIREIKAMLAN